MKKVSLILGIGLLCISLSSLAGEYLMNDTGETVTGLRVVFSEPVLLTGFGDVLIAVAPVGESTEFIFSGGGLGAWDGHWFNYSPVTACVMEYEWLTGSITALQGLLAEQQLGRPVVIGNLLNPDYFVHPAYVMQGVSERDAVFAMPLDGVEELAVYPIVDGVDLEDVTWSVEISHPEGIGAIIEGKTLYIWGSNASWAGYGEVTLEAGLGDAVSSVAIPVAVFREDKTLINTEGKKDYFVPWSPELDINRILSVEEHMRTYSKDEGNLDRSIQWSRWKKMEYRKDVDFITLWFNSSIPWAHGWNESAQFALVDVLFDELKRLGVNGIRLRDIYYFMGLTGTELVPIYNRAWFGVTRRPHETAYVVNEAHRCGMSVVLGNAYFPHVASRGYELFSANPTPREEFFANVLKQEQISLRNWMELGVDIVDLGTQLETINNENSVTWEKARHIDTMLAQMADDARKIYPGPLYHAALPFGAFYPGKTQLEAEFWEHYDILGSGMMALRITSYSDPTLAQLIEGWEMLIEDYHQPFQERYNKPLLAYENGCPSVKGCVNWGNYGGDCFGAESSSKPLNVEDMQLWYLSHDQAFGELDGYYGPGWHFYVFSPFSPGSIRDRSVNPRLKIESVIQNIFLGEIRPNLIAIDGSVSDWLDNYEVSRDPVGDSSSRYDLETLSFTQDSSYLYFCVEYADSPTGHLTVEIDINGDLNADVLLKLTDQYTPDGTWWGNSWITDLQDVPIGFVDSINAGSFVELRVHKRFLEGILNKQYLGIRLSHQNAAWHVQDETDWLTLLGTPQVPASSVFELLEHGSLASDTFLLVTGNRSIVGEHTGSSSFNPYLRTSPSRLPLVRVGHYKVCFDYRIIETGANGFEVLFLSPTGASKNQWVLPLRINGHTGESGHSCLEAQLLDFSDYEIRWNVISTGVIAIDNVVITDLRSGRILAEEDFETWWSEDFNR